MAHKKGVSSSRNGRDSQGQRLGVKAYGGEMVNAGTILVRQRGTRIHPGINVLRGKDDTLFATKTGKVLYHRLGKLRKQVSIVVEQDGTEDRAAAPTREMAAKIPAVETVSVNDATLEAV